MDPHPTPFRGKRKSVAAAPAKTPAPKPKPAATARGKMPFSTSSAVPSGAAPQPRPRRAFGTVRSSNSLAEKPAPQKHTKLSPPPPPQKPLKLSPPKPAKASPPPPQKPAKASSSPLQKPWRLSPPNATKAARPSRPAEKPLKKACPGPGPDLPAKAKKKSQRVSFQDGVKAVPASGSVEKVKASTEDSAGRTPMVPVKALEKMPAKVVAAETPFFSAQNCSSCTLDQLETASYWLAQIHLAESVGKHNVSAAFFRLAFECQAQPVRRIQSELRHYVVRHEGAGTLTPLFHELLLAHAMKVNQLKFDTDGSEKVDTHTATNTVEQQLDVTTLVQGCSESDCGGDLVDVREVSIVKQGEEDMDQLRFAQKLDESFEFDDSEAVIVDRLAEEHSEFKKMVGLKAPCDDSEMIQSVCRSSIDKLSLKGSPVARGTSERRLSSESHLDKLSPSARSLSAKRLSTGSPFNNSPFCRGSLKSLTSSCPSSKRSSTKGLPSKRMSSDGCSDGEHNAAAGAGDSSRVIQDHTLVGQLKFQEHEEYAAIDELHAVEPLKFQEHEEYAAIDEIH